MIDENIQYPIRINRYLYLENISSRREADRLIEDGQVFVNGKVAVLGQKISKDDVVTLSSKAKKKVTSYVYYIVNKPKGIESHNAQDGAKDIVSMLNLGKGVAVVGRLDKDSSGLMLLTNDGRIVDKMLNPKYDHEKEYVVSVDKELKESFKRKIERGVDIEGYITKPAKVRTIGPKTFRIILTEGKKHQIRRMLASLGYTTMSLRRVRIMGIELGNLKDGEHRLLNKEEKTRLLKTLDII